MPDNPDPTKTVFKKMQRTTINTSPSQKISAIRYFLNAPQEQIEIFNGGLTLTPLPADWFSLVRLTL